ncbi:hypothetical protein P4H37_03830, partial [Paenibacillus thiaminolyticus]|uniref:hypothetical protein n=1 Tax=Paenibacillus thiaminolyticus TaxID=49283 RepID=UPI002DBC0CAD
MENPCFLRMGGDEFHYIKNKVEKIPIYFSTAGFLGIQETASDPWGIIVFRKHHCLLEASLPSGSIIAFWRHRCLLGLERVEGIAAILQEFRLNESTSQLSPYNCVKSKWQKRRAI